MINEMDLVIQSEYVDDAIYLVANRKRFVLFHDQRELILIDATATQHLVSVPLLVFFEFRVAGYLW